MIVALLSGLVLLCATVHGGSTRCCEPPPIDLPECLDLSISNTRTASILKLDEVLLNARTKQSLTDSAMYELHRVIGKDGPVGQLQIIDKYVYNRFLTNWTTAFGRLTCDVFTEFQRLVDDIENTLCILVPPCKVHAAIDRIVCLVGGIKVHIPQMANDSRDGFWSLYQKVAVDIRNLHARRCTSPAEYNRQLEGVLKNGSVLFNRSVNGGAFKMERYLLALVTQIRVIVLEALQENCKWHKGSVLSKLVLW